MQKNEESPESTRGYYEKAVLLDYYNRASDSFLQRMKNFNF